MVQAKLKKPKPEPKEDPALELAKSTIALTEEMWFRLKRDADLQNRSESFVAREIVGLHYKIPPEERNPPRRRRRTKEELGK